MIIKKWTKSFYILVCSDGYEPDSIKHSAKSIAQERISRKEWPLYKSTLFRTEIKQGDTCLIYLAGNSEHSQCFIAKADIEETQQWTLRSKYYDSGIIADRAAAIVKFSQALNFPPVPIRQFIGKLSIFPPGTKNWGCRLQGGCTKILRSDFEIISRSIIQATHTRN